MKIIKEGKLPPRAWRKTCYRCSTEFEYDISDIKKRWCEAPYVKCPFCGASIWHTD